MAIPIAMPVRKIIIQEGTSGKILGQTARKQDLSYWTVRTLWQHYVNTDRLPPVMKPVVVAGFGLQSECIEGQCSLSEYIRVGAHP
jgi:hypothetical protein